MSQQFLIVTDPATPQQLQRDTIVGADAKINLDANGIPILSSRVPGAQMHHDMGAGANQGEIRVGPGGQLQTLEGSGQGGDTYAWHNWSPQNLSQVQRSWFFQRYGPNWSSVGGHSPNVRSQLEEFLQRPAGLGEVNDIIYGIKPMPGGTTPAPQAPAAPKPVPTPVSVSKPPAMTTQAPAAVPSALAIATSEVEAALQEMEAFIGTLPDSERMRKVRTYQHNIVLAVQRLKAASH